MKEVLSFTNTIVDINISEILKKELKNYKNILIITGKTAYEKAKTRLNLENKNYSINYVKECSHSVFNEIFNCEIKKINTDFDIVLGIGGGKALDTAKFIANKLKLNILTIPTIAATCAATSGLSVIYDDNAKFLDFAIYDDLNIKCLIDLEIIKNAPKRFLIAGIGDTMAKFYEFDIKYKMAIKNGEEIDYSNILGKTCSILCKDLNYNYAINAINSQEINLEFKQVVMAIILNTGIVSRLIKMDYNGALAHAVCYGLGVFSSIEKNFLHGELVAFGILVQMLLENNLDEYKKLCEFYKQINLPTKIDDFITKDEFLTKIDEAMDFILKTQDAKYLIKSGFLLDKENLKQALIYKKEN